MPDSEGQPQVLSQTDVQICHEGHGIFNHGTPFVIAVDTTAQPASQLRHAVEDMLNSRLEMPHHEISGPPSADRDIGAQSYNDDPMTGLRNAEVFGAHDEIGSAWLEGRQIQLAAGSRVKRDEPVFGGPGLSPRRSRRT